MQQASIPEKTDLRLNTAAIVFSHSPSVAEPSQVDIQISVQLKSALVLVNLHVLDYIIITEDD